MLDQQYNFNPSNYELTVLQISKYAEEGYQPLADRLWAKATIFSYYALLGIYCSNPVDMSMYTKLLVPEYDYKDAFALSHFVRDNPHLLIPDIWNEVFGYLVASFVLDKQAVDAIEVVPQKNKKPRTKKAAKSDDSDAE
jgi:hypothetical protein